MGQKGLEEVAGQGADGAGEIADERFRRVPPNTSKLSTMSSLARILHRFIDITFT